MSNSSNTGIRDYLAERFPPGQFVPLALMLLLASLVGGREVHVSELALQFGLTLSWIFQFRLWDDLHDRERDRKQHPYRVLVRAASPARYCWLAGIVALGNLVATGLLLSWTIAVTLLVPLTLLLAALYRARGVKRLVHAQVEVLMKYPVFVLMLSGGATEFSVVAGLVMLLIYFTFAVYELLHDPSLRAGKTGRMVLLVEVLALGTVWFLVAGSTVATHPIAAAGLAGLAVGGCILLSRLWRVRAGGGATTHRRIFLPAILQLAVLTLLS